MSTGPPKKTIRIKAERHRAMTRARVALKERGEEVPTRQEMAERAIEAWIKANCPEALEPPPPGRPRKSPRKPL